MIVDSSAFVSIVLNESDSEYYSRKVWAARTRKMSAVTLTETSMVLFSRGGQAKIDIFDALVRALEVEIVPFDRAQAMLAYEAFKRYGKGMKNAAHLNLADCFVYALAKQTGEPLLFKGNDFSQTDLERA